MIRPNSRSIIDVTDPQESRTWDGINRQVLAAGGTRGGPPRAVSL